MSDTAREQFDCIYNSMVNGQKRQAVEQIEEMGLDKMPDLLHYFSIDLDYPEMAINTAKTYFSIKHS